MNVEDFENNKDQSNDFESPEQEIKILKGD